MEHEDWNRLSAVALHIGIGKDGAEMVYLINQTSAPARFTLPNDSKQTWTLICDTNVRNISLVTQRVSYCSLQYRWRYYTISPKKRPKAASLINTRQRLAKPASLILRPLAF